MLQTKVDICNLALLHLGTTLKIVNLSDDRSHHAAVLRQWLPLTLETFLELHPWTCATKFGALTLHESDPTKNHMFSYANPSDAVTIRQIARDGIFPKVNLYEEQKLKWEEVTASGSKYIYTNVANAHAEYTMRLDIDGSFPIYFARGLAAMLALDIAPGIVAQNFPKIKDALLSMKNKEVDDAIATDLAKQPLRSDSPSPFLLARMR